MQEKEEKIRLERTKDAIRNNLMGVEGKIGFILKYLGTPISGEIIDLDDTFGDFINKNKNYLPDFYDLPDENSMPMLPREYDSPDLGMIFDGLSQGIHIEMKWDSEENQIKVLYKGYIVYLETAGVLDCYVPGEWEALIEPFYVRAKKKSEKEYKQELKENKQADLKEKQSFLKLLRNKWGFS